MKYYKVFPQERTTILVSKLQDLEKNKFKLSEDEYNRKYKQLLSDLYPILEFVAYTQINKKVQKFNNYVTYNSFMAEGMQNIKDDLMLYAIDQMIKYIPKIDINRKISNVLYITQVRSSRVYLYSTLLETKHNDLSLDYYEDEDSEMDWLLKETNDEIFQDNLDEEIIDNNISIFDFNHEKIEERFISLFDNILLDYKNDKISNYSFRSFILILIILKYYIENLKSNSILFDNINNKQLKIHNTKNYTLYLQKLVLLVYKEYTKNMKNDFKIILNKMIIVDFIKRYL